MEAIITIKFELNQSEIDDFMFNQKGYEIFTKEDLERELKGLNLNQLKYIAYFDDDEKEIEVKGELK